VDEGPLASFEGMDDLEVLEREQRRLAALAPLPWRPGDGPIVAAGVFVAYARGEQGPGRRGDRSFVGAAATRDVEEITRVVVPGRAGARYEPGFVAGREGAIQEAALRALLATGVAPDVVLVDATGRDHPRRAGLALQLGAVVGLPTVGVTHRPLRAHGAEPDDVAGASTPLELDGDVVGAWLRVHRGVRPLAVHAAWRTDVDIAVDVVLRFTARARTPEPLRLARTAAREARSDHEGRRVQPARGSVS
jgi:deoxyribonuclease V